MTIRWITERLGTAPAGAVVLEEGMALLDVRDLVDKSGNTSQAVKAKIDSGLDILATGKRLVVGCDYGMSRSNAIAAGVLARSLGITVDQAATRVIAATGEGTIKIEVLAMVRATLEPQEATLAPPADGTILITGGTGFLGRALVATLTAAGRHISAPPRTEVDLIGGRAQLDILVRRLGVTRIVHLAHPRVYTSNLAMGEALTMLRNVLEVCIQNNVSLVYPSRWEVYSGYPTATLKAGETLPLLPKGPDGETKMLCEALINQFRRTTTLRCLVMRLSTVYGPHGARPRFIHTFIEKARAGAEITTHRYNNAPAALDLLHIQDATSALKAAAIDPLEGDLNLGSGNLTPTAMVADRIITLTGSSSPVRETLINADTACIVMDYSRAQAMMGWKPRWSMEDGLRNMVQNHLNAGMEKVND